MSKLTEDLEKYANEAWNKKDIGAGLKLIAEFSGIAGLGVLGYTVLASWIPGLNAIGITISPLIITRAINQAAKQYTNLPEEKRAVVRKAVRFLNGIF